MTEAEKLATIRKRCPTCKHGAWKRQRIICSCWAHPGEMGTTGTLWAAGCSYYEATKTIGVIVEKVILVKSEEEAKK